VKPVLFHPKALAFIREEGPEVRKQVGEALRDLQKGISLGPPLSRPMPAVASGVHELRIRSKPSTIRVFYLAKLAEAIVVFHAFHKKTQKTPKHDLDIGRHRLHEVMHGNV
jgi:phage-related protein